MKAILVLFDSLSRRYLPPYGNTWVNAPNFSRLAEQSVTFDSCYVGSMPCIPARRELHTGRHNFLHRSWGPLEPFDDSMPQLLSRNGVYTHMVTDHYHYWEDGGATYHNRYSSYDMVRGQERDRWKGGVADPDIPEHIGDAARSDWVNRGFIREEADTCQARTFASGLEFLANNHTEDNWFLQIECFDPHPPFFAPQRYRDLYAHEYSGPHFDCPRYGAVMENETPDMIQHLRYQYASVISMCDHYLGRLLEAMDTHALWSDTLLIVTTDHGFFLGERGAWAFCWLPFYGEVANKPFFVWDPRCGRKSERNSQLVQTHDIPATLLEYFGIERPGDMHGMPLKETLASGSPVREAALFGVFGGHVNCTDGRYVYMRAPVASDNGPLYEYTLMPTHMRAPFSPQELRTAEMAPPFTFTKGCQTMKIEGRPFMVDAHRFGSLLFDLQEDPQQEQPLQDRAMEDRMLTHLLHLMKENDAPEEQYRRLGLI